MDEIAGKISITFKHPHNMLKKIGTILTELYDSVPDIMTYL